MFMHPSNPHNPVLLVHGIWDTGKIFQKMAANLRQLGWDVHTLDLVPNNGAAKLEDLAAQVAAYLQATFPPNTPLDLVGFSMGGIVSRYYIQRLGGIDRVQRFITLSAPHHGTWTAYGSFYPGCIQMRPNSPLLQDLNRDVAMLDRLNLTSIWTPLDAMILPASSSQLPVGKEMQVWVSLHRNMVTDPRSLKLVAAALAEPLRQSTVQASTLSPIWE